MLYTLVVLAGVFNYVFAAPLSSCETQADCIDASITELDELDDNDNVQYEICLIFDGSLDECVKDEADEISHACVAGEDGIVQEEDGEKLEGLASGRDDALCDIIPCGSMTTFGLKDGRSCELDGELLYANLSIPDYDDLLMCYSGMSCNANGRNDKACKWAIRSPPCEDGTTTAPIDTTPATPVSTVEPASTPVDEPCVCQDWANGENAVTDRYECESRCNNGCTFLEGDNMCVRTYPTDAAMVYKRARTTNDLVGGTDDEDGTTDTSENNGGIVYGVSSVVGVLYMVGLYLLQ